MLRHPSTSAIVFTLILLGARASPATAQTPAGDPKPAKVPAFNTARTPTSPAFTLFGFEPSAVERPANPSALAFAFLSKAGDLTTVPQDFALDASPFWLVKQPMLQWRDDIKRNVGDSLARTASVSVATGEIGTKNAAVRGLAFGGRADILSGTLSKETQAQIERLETLLQAEAAFGLRMMAAQLVVLSDKLRAGEITREQHTEMMRVLQEAMLKSKDYRDSAERKAVEKLMERFATVRDGFFLEVAGAAGWRYPSAIWSQGKFDRWGLWATPSFVGKSGSIVGVLRYLSEDAAAGTDERVLDYGVRGVHFRDRYAVSLEYVRRAFKAENLKDGQRFVGIAEYAVTDTTWFVVSVGRDHDTKREGSLIARLGLTVTFNEERFLKPSGEK
jgi:hypothetical protein